MHVLIQQGNNVFEYVVIVETGVRMQRNDQVKSHLHWICQIYDICKWNLCFLYVWSHSYIKKCTLFYGL